MITRLVLIGMSGAGKSTVGRLAADVLGWQFVDMDDTIEQRSGRTIPEIFAADGEAAFRALESALLAELLDQDQLVISTGGGAPCNDTAQQLLAASPSSLSIWLHAEAHTLWQRVNEHADTTRTTARPMLTGDDPLARMTTLLEARRHYYAAADVTIPVEARPAEGTAADLAELVKLANGEVSTVHLANPQIQSEIRVGRGVSDSLPAVIYSRWPKAQAIWIGADANVARVHREWIDHLRERTTASVHVIEVPAGESSKSLDSYGSVMNWMLTGGVQRGDVVVALGGGVVGDLMGFAAATVLRGVGLVQVPTTLLSMVDSSVGGKTGINHAAGKNLIGAFYQPPVVLVDTRFLSTLPGRELRSGFAEVIKHGVIQASTPRGEAGFLTSVLQLNAAALLERREPLLSWVVRQNISLKASVVAADEREANLRQILNFGHTIGHGIEASGYRLLHGEAIAVGMIAAANLAVERGDVEARFVDSLRSLIEAYQLPTTADATCTQTRRRMPASRTGFCPTRMAGWS